MKKILLTALFSIIPALAHASVDAPQSVTNVAQTYRSTMTCMSVSISSAGNVGLGATQVIVSTQTLWAAITVQNRDSTANIYCGDSVNVSSQSALGTFNVQTGFELGAGSPGGSASFYLGPGELWYCVNDTTTRASNATVCRGH